MLKLVFELDLKHCPNCGGEMNIGGAILRGEPGRERTSCRPFAHGERQGVFALALAIEKILTQLLAVR